MSNFFWSANGHYIKKNIIETYLDDENKTNINGFSFSNSTLCIDDICLSKDELYKLKDSNLKYIIKNPVCISSSESNFNQTK